MRAALILPSALLILVSCGGSDDASSPTQAAETTAETTAETAAEITTTTSGNTGRRQETDCTDEQNFDDADGDGWGYCVPRIATTTTEETTTSTTTPDVSILIVGSAIETDNDVRQILIDLVMDADASVESVDVLTFETTNEGTATLAVALTTGFSSQDIIDEIAWAVARDLAFAWGESDDGGIFRNVGGKVLVGLRLSVDSSTYNATHDQMVSVVDVRMSSTDWLSQTRS